MLLIQVSVRCCRVVPLNTESDLCQYLQPYRSQTESVPLPVQSQNNVGSVIQKNIGSK